MPGPLGVKERGRYLPSCYNCCKLYSFKNFTWFEDGYKHKSTKSESAKSSFQDKATPQNCDRYSAYSTVISNSNSYSNSYSNSNINSNSNLIQYFFYYVTIIHLSVR